MAGAILWERLENDHENTSFYDIRAKIREIAGHLLKLN